MTEAADAMRQAHRRPNFRAHHPLLIWHLGLWNNVAKIEGSDGSVVREAEGRTERLEKAKDYARALEKRIQKGLKEVLGAEAGSEALTSLKDPDGRWIFAFKFGAFLATIRLECSAEYLTVTTLLDMSASEGAEYWLRSPPAAKTIIRQLAALQAKIDVSSVEGIPHLAREDLGPLAEACFEDIWTDFGATILKVDADDFRDLGTCFADFRGFVIGDEALISNGSRNAERLDEAAPPAGEPDRSTSARPIRIQQPFWHAEDPDRRDHKSSPLEQDWRGRFHVLWPLMTAPVKGKNLLDHEFTATIFEDSALQLTAMGAAPTGSDGVGTPLYYGIYASGAGGWAIGRLVNQLCDLGTFRLAATKEMEELHKASILLRDAEIEVQRAFDLDLGAASAAGSHSLPGRESTEPLQEALGRIHDKKRQADREVTGGIAFRVEQSAYYVQRFKQVLKGLRMGVHDDFQPYGRFVRANHGAWFAFIELLGSRQDRLMLDMRSLFERMATEEGRNRSQELLRLQRFAESLSIGFLAPYYFGMVLAHMLWDEPYKMKQVWWIAVFAGAIATALYYRNRDERMPRVKLSRFLAIWFLAAGSGVFIILGMRTAAPSLNLPGEAILLVEMMLVAIGLGVVLTWPKTIRRRGPMRLVLLILLGLAAVGLGVSLTAKFEDAEIGAMNTRNATQGR